MMPYLTAKKRLALLFLCGVFCSSLQGAETLPHDNDALVLQAFYADATAPNPALVCFDSQRSQYVGQQPSTTAQRKNGSLVGYASLCGSLLSMNQETRDYLHSYGYTRESLKRLCKQHCFPEGLNEETPYHTLQEYQEKREKDRIKEILRAPQGPDATQDPPQNSTVGISPPSTRANETAPPQKSPQSPAWKKAAPQDRKIAQQT